MRGPYLFKRFDHGILLRPKRINIGRAFQIILIISRLQNKALWRLKQLGIVHGKANEIWLNPVFRENFLKSLYHPTFLPTSTPYDGKDSIDEQFYRKWNGILYSIASGGKSNEMYLPASGSTLNILLNCGLVLKEKSTIQITSQGFQFLLADASEQIVTLLIQYCMSIEGDKLIEALESLFILSFLAPDQFYELKHFSASQKTHLKALSDLGLVIMTKQKNVAGFVPTRLVRGITHVSDEAFNISKENGFIIMETNYKFYAYTQSPLQLSILSLFLRVRTRFANMIFCQLSQDSMHEAFKKGITAQQIIRFLHAAAHPIMRDRTPVIPPTLIDQITLWEQDRNRLQAKTGYLYQQFLSASDFEKTVAEATKIGAVLYANPGKRLLVVSEDGHGTIKSFVKSNI